MKKAAPAIAEHTLKVLEYGTLLETVAEKAMTQGGRKLLLSLLPETDLEKVRERIAETTEFRDLLDAGNQPHPGNLPDLDLWFAEITSRRVPFEPEELNDIASALEMCGDLREQMKERAPFMPRMHVYGERIGDFSDLTRAIREAIGPDDKVRDGASKELKEIRRQLSRLENLIQDRLQYIMNGPACKDSLENRNILERNGRPVIALKASARRAVPGVLHDKSQTGQTVFIEPQAVTGLANELEERRYEERREVTRILWGLTSALAERQLSILLAAKAAAYIDATLAKARFSHEYACTAPDISEDGSLEITEARHPLLCKYAAQKARKRPQEVFDRLTPLDFRLGEDFNIVVVTGPNTGGKTVVLKTLGLLALMAQTGLHVPARHPLRMPVYKGVFVDIGDEQSIEQSLSTFSSHLTNMAEILTECDGESLVLLDEVGSGTDPAEGAALGMATLDFLRQKGSKTVITTHLGALKAYAYQAPEVENASMEFDRATLLPTYRLLLGQPGSSNALAIARRYKLPSELTDRMAELLSEEREDAADLIRSVQHVKSVAEKARRRNERLRQKLTQSLKDASKEKEDALEQAEASIAYTMQDVMKEVEEYCANCDSAPEPWRTLTKTLKERLTAISQGTPREQHRLDFLAALQPGDTVYLVTLQAFGEVKKINHRQRTARVMSGGILYDLPFQSLDEKPFVTPDRRKVQVRTPAPRAPRVQAVAPPEKPAPLPPVRRRLQNGKFLERLKPGDVVFVPQFQDRGPLTALDRDRNRARVKLGLIEVQVQLDTLEPPGK